MKEEHLLQPFYDAEKPRARWRVGTEAEKFGVLRDPNAPNFGAPLPFAGARSVQTVLVELRDRHGWFEYREHEHGELIALRRGDASITLEPGGQLELSGAPFDSIHQTCAEFRGHMAELRDISEELGVGWIGLGFHPTARQEDLPWVPKLRYGIMKEYLPTRGSMALDMMRRTATVQANFDYADEADASRKVRVSLALSPIVTAMFANSPFVDGQMSGEVDRRAKVWLNTDPDRSGLLPFAWSESFGYRDYVEWALDVPMFLFQRGPNPIHNTGQTFRSFIEHGFEGHFATPEDWTSHLNTLFPEVRLKSTIEIRGADGQSTDMVCALPALTKGVLYDDVALGKAEQLVAPLDFATVNAVRASVAQEGLRAELAGRPVLEWARELLEISEGGLERLGHFDRQGRDERVHLSKLRALLETGQTPAEELSGQIDPDADLLPQLIDLSIVV